MTLDPYEKGLIRLTVGLTVADLAWSAAAGALEAPLLRVLSDRQAREDMAARVIAAVERQPLSERVP